MFHSAIGSTSVLCSSGYPLARGAILRENPKLCQGGCWRIRGVWGTEHVKRQLSEVDATNDVLSSYARDVITATMDARLRTPTENPLWR